MRPPSPRSESRWRPGIINLNRPVADGLLWPADNTAFRVCRRALPRSPEMSTAGRRPALVRQTRAARSAGRFKEP